MEVNRLTIQFGQFQIIRCMKIATWNIERLKHKNKIQEITRILEEIDADIVILTETDNQVKLENYSYKLETTNLTLLDPSYYKSTENRVTIYSKYELLRKLETYNNFTSCCGEFKTEYGNLVVYGTIIGIYGNRHTNFKNDIVQQLGDIKNLSKNEHFCIAGDFNISFSDNYYYTKLGRDGLNKSFEENNLVLATRVIKECIDHIAISQKLIHNQYIDITQWNIDKKLSDHKGICVDIKIR